jgi:hypothetical protein
VLFGQGRDEDHAFLDDVRHLHVVDGNRAMSGLDLRQIQDFVDQFQQVLAAAKNVVDVFVLLTGEMRHWIVLEELP